MEEYLEEYDYMYSDFSNDLLINEEKNKISVLYQNKKEQVIIDKILLRPELAIYEDYQWVAYFYKKHKNKEQLEYFISLLYDYLSGLKQMGIKNNESKSNVLITIYILSELSVSEICNLLVKNIKYLKFVTYVIENIDDYYELYKQYISKIENNYIYNKEYIPKVLYYFTERDKSKNLEITYNYYLYSYLCCCDTEFLELLEKRFDVDKVIKFVEDKTNNFNVLSKLYLYFDKKDELYNMIVNSNKDYFIKYTRLLKDSYGKELYTYYIEQFYNILKLEKSRENYHRAAEYIKGIYNLNNGSKLVTDIVKELRSSNYSKCIALFDEIDKSKVIIDDNY